MIINIKYEARPFPVPSEIVLVQLPTLPGSGNQAPRVNVKDVDAQVLSELCNDFRRSVFQLARKPDPELQPTAVAKAAYEAEFEQPKTYAEAFERAGVKALERMRLDGIKPDPDNPEDDAPERYFEAC